MPASQSFDKCTACSDTIVDMYRKEGFEFLLRAFNQNSYLEDLSGLTALKEALDENEPEFVIELSDCESIWVFVWSFVVYSNHVIYFLFIPLLLV